MHAQPEFFDRIFPTVFSCIIEIMCEFLTYRTLSQQEKPKPSKVRHTENEIPARIVYQKESRKIRLQCKMVYKW